MKEPMAVRDARRNSDGEGSRSPLGLASLPPERDRRAASSRTFSAPPRFPLHLLRELGERLVEALVRRGWGEGRRPPPAPPRAPTRGRATPPRRRGDAPGRIAGRGRASGAGAPSGRDVLTIGALQRSAPFPRLASAPRGRASDASGILHRATPVCTPARRDTRPRAMRHFQTHLTARRRARMFGRFGTFRPTTRR